MARIKRSYLPDDLTAQDREILDNEPRLLRLGRLLRKKVYRRFKRRHRRRLAKRVLRWFGLGGGG